MMNSASWYIMHEGRRLLAATKAEARHLAQLVADATGKRVTVRPIKKPAAKARAARPAAPVKKTMRRNPDPGSFIPFWQEQEKGRQARREFNAATKGRRLAKSLRGRDRGGAVKAAERGAVKTAKFAVDVANRREAYTLYRASRSAALSLSRQFEAAGYQVKVREV